jgi:hypothetical protein
MRWVLQFKRHRKAPAPALPPITAAQLAEWESVAQAVYDNSLGQTDPRWTRLRFQALQALEQLRHAATTATGRTAPPTAATS